MTMKTNQGTSHDYSMLFRAFEVDPDLSKRGICDCVEVDSVLTNRGT